MDSISLNLFHNIERIKSGVLEESLPPILAVFLKKGRMLYNFKLVINFDLSPRKIHSVRADQISSLDLSSIECIIKDEQQQSCFLCISKNALINDSHDPTIYNSLCATREYISEDSGSESLHISEAIRALSDPIGRCGIKFYLVSVGSQVKIYYEAHAHLLVVKVLSTYNHKMNFIN